MLLDLSRIKGPHEHFEQVYPAEAFAADREDFRVVAPVSLAFDIFKDKSQYRLAGRTQTTHRAAVQPVSRADHDRRWTRRSTCGISRIRRTPAGKQTPSVRSKKTISRRRSTRTTRSISAS